MCVVKMLGMIFLAVFLIFTGLASLSEVALAPMAKSVLDLVGLTSGILILISIGKCFPSKQ